MRRSIIIIALLLAIVGFGMTQAGAQYGPTTTTLPPCTGQVGDAWDNCTPPSTTVPFDDGDLPPCAEDEPCWDCATMGNRICGTPTYPVPTGPVPGSPRFTG